MEKNNSANNNCRFCLRIFDDDNDERIVITSQISEEFRNITQTEVYNTNKKKIINLNFMLLYAGLDKSN